MNDKTIQIIISATDKASRVLSEVGSELQGLSNKTKSAMATSQSAMDDSDKSASRFGSTLGTLGSRIRFVAETFAIYGIAREIERFTTASVSAAGQLEQTSMAFQSLTGNVQIANEVFAQLVKYANVTPFQTQDIVKAAQTLMGFGTAGQQTVDILKQLGDVVSVSGGDLQQLSLVTGQVFAQGKLRAQDMYQVINDGGAGLIKIMAANVGGMQNLTAEFDSGGIPAKQYFDAITEATAKGGFAFQGAQKQAETLNGRISTLKDSVIQFGMALIGVKIDPQLGLVIQPGGLFDRFKNAIGAITSELQKIGPAVNAVMPQLLTSFGTIAGAIGQVLTPILSTLGNVVVLVASHFSALFGPSLTAIYNTLAGRLIPSIVQLYNSLQPALGNVLKILAALFGATLYAALWATINTLNVIISVIGDVIRIISTVIGWVGNFVAVVINGARSVAGSLSGLPGWVSGAVAGVFGALTAPFQAAYNVISGIVGAIHKVVSDVIGAISSVKNAVTGGIHLPSIHIPGFASGVQNFSGGLAIVGEQGPELVNLPRGSSVIPANESKKLAGTTNFNIYGNINLGDSSAVDRFFERLNAQKEMGALGVGI